MSHTLAAHITQLSITSQLEDYSRRHGLPVQITSAAPGGPLTVRMQDREMSLRDAAERYLGGYTAACGRTVQAWETFLAGPFHRSPTALAFRDAWQTYAAAADTAAVAAIANIAEQVRTVYPDAVSISCESFRNDDGNKVLRLRGVWDGTGRRLAAIDDDQVDYGQGWPVGGNDPVAQELAYDHVDSMLSALIELDDRAYLGDDIHTITLPAPAGNTCRPVVMGQG